MEAEIAVSNVRNLALSVVDALAFLFFDHDGRSRDLQGRSVEDHLILLGCAADGIRSNRSAFDRAFVRLGQDSRGPVQIGFVSGSSTTEYVLNYGAMFVGLFRNTFLGLTLTLSDRGKLLDRWSNLRPFLTGELPRCHYASLLPTGGQCDRWKAEIKWECIRADEHQETAGPPRKRKTTGLSLNEANERAILLAKDDPGFLKLTLRQWAEKIGCSEGQIPDLSLWRKTMERTGRGKRNRPTAPKAVTLTENMEAMIGEGEQNEVLRRLTAEQEADRRADGRGRVKKRV